MSLTAGGASNTPVLRARETWWRRTGMPLTTHAVLVAGCVAMLFPYLWMLGTSFKPPDETMLWPPRVLPIHWTWANYPQALDAAPFGLYLLNSLVVAVGATVMVGTPASLVSRRVTPSSAARPSLNSLVLSVSLVSGLPRRYLTNAFIS